MKNKSQNAGISMVSLVATIIVLLMLAGVSLNMIQGDNGVVKRAANSADIYQNAQEEERKELLGADYRIDENNSQVATINKLKGKSMIKLTKTVADDHLTTTVTAEKNATNNTIDLTNYKIVMRTSDDDENTWTETTSVTVDEANMTVYACLYDGTNWGAVTTQTITDYDVDRIPPEITLAQLKPVLFGVTTTIKSTDEGGSTLDYDKCGYVFTTSSADNLGTDVSKYYKRINTSGPTTTIVDGLAAGTYYLHVLLTDKKGNTTTKVSTDSVTVASVENIAYSGNYKSYQLAPGKYKLEVWGARGGNGPGGNYYGGYSYGTLDISSATSATNFYAYVGGAGTDRNTAQNTSAGAGGWNGGGSGGSALGAQSYYGTAGSGGGGGTDFRIGDTSMYARVIVAGGGGGGMGYSNWYGWSGSNRYAVGSSGSCNPGWSYTAYSGTQTSGGSGANTGDNDVYWGGSNSNAYGGPAAGGGGRRRLVRWWTVVMQ